MPQNAGDFAFGERIDLRDGLLHLGAFKWLVVDEDERVQTDIQFLSDPSHSIALPAPADLRIPRFRLTSNLVSLDEGKDSTGYRPNADYRFCCTVQLHTANVKCAKHFAK